MSKALYRELFQPHEIKGLIAAESKRHGGISPFPEGALNLGWFSKDFRENIEENRNRFFQSIGIHEADVAHMEQVHGDSILMVDQPGVYPECDGLITGTEGVFLSVTIADCTPIVVIDPVKRLVGVAHAGWRGTVKRIAWKLVKVMEAGLGAQAKDCMAYIGTCISADSYEVDADVANHFTEECKAWDGIREKFYVDMKKTNSFQLSDAGIPVDRQVVSPFCTVLNNEDYFSHRKEKA